MQSTKTLGPDSNEHAPGWSNPDFFPDEKGIPDKLIREGGLSINHALIAGELRDWRGPFAEVLSPICKKTEDGSDPQPLVIGKTPLMNGKAALQALDAAVNAYGQGRGDWPSFSVARRIEHVEQFLAEMRSHREAVVELLMWEIGKTYNDACKEFDRTADYISDTIHELKVLDRRSSRFETVGGVVAQTRRLPVGVALCMGPYNYPLNETFTTLIPALIMGNTVVFKPAKYGVLLIAPLLEAFRNSFPPGVINVIFGRGRDTVGPLMKSGHVDMFAFIGTHKGASALKQMHPKPHRLKAVLGLDANNPAIVLADADLDLAVSECVAGALSFNGQRCTALKLLLVHESLAEEFVSRFSVAVNNLVAGMPWDKNVALTPLPEPGKVAYLRELVKDAETNGAAIVNEGGGQANGTYFHPALLYPVTTSMRIYSEEQFGPVIPVVAFRNEAEAIRHVRDSEFGQQLSIFGTDPETMGGLIDILANQVGRINLNGQCQRGPDTLPFNGRKDSAEGTLSVSDALRVFSIRTTVSTKSSERNRDLVTGIVRGRHSRTLTTDYLF
ncbi:NADP-dependent glyceraldehyde-3-phosphate dehydrogenase [Marinobacter salexigens]|uniref:NADP-dependent glyceraldehyde-3-phosphate dehydrogenase n=1 Tax=Marinobacter salexigens TaxID=1925763 RepID=A0ABS6ABF8_9GAMM|nr:NADP-dependent glyceraldehyde-3-phosphate dehydrogenase [Marinobacter salexigens]MBU2875429.1 NADP-dependent glyceraldehyde-3-phosphate dehydrogenase [Marinobacter salexigens]